MLSSLSENELLRLIRISSLSENDVRLRRLQFRSNASLSNEFLSQELLGARSNETREHSSIIYQAVSAKLSETRGVRCWPWKGCLNSRMGGLCKKCLIVSGL
uniref:Uncharacterized protein n=1 Tax=Cryptomonas curvata TaxID=233186 RepID=A0A7S0QNI8_9CRYP|mmetsp:Transcript_38981/g.81754  ORF Transcript_38981/g.81754 Transcript_38981/m.81754 type:complete len:102 (+) Transcript_38981:238-543(+)